MLININSKKKISIVYIVLMLATLAVFWQVNQSDFINFDDNIYVTENSHIQSGITLDGFRWAFSTKYFYLWHPLVWLSLMFDYQLHGLNAGGYHLTNLILHILSALLLFWLFNRMTGAIWKSAFVAGLFALHPLHVESVAWISERKDVLSAFFWMLTLCLYVYYTEKPVIKRYLLVLLCFACALMSKPMVVTLPVVMILLDYWPLSRCQTGIQPQKIADSLTEIMPVSKNQTGKKTKSKKQTLKESISSPNKQKLPETKIAGSSRSKWQLWEKTPFFILSVVLVVITIYAPNPDTSGAGESISLGSRIANALVSFVSYLEKTFWPHDLAIFYPFADQLPIWQVLVAALLILVISVYVILELKRLPSLFVGWLWYAITILPVVGFLQIGDFAMADRYTYLPLIGIGIMLAWGVPLLFKSEETQKKILFPIAIAFLAVLSVLTWQQCSYWKNSITLFNHALKVTKNNSLAHNNLGTALSAEEKLEEAIYHYNEAIRLNPHDAYFSNNRGNAYARLGKHQLAIEDYSKAISLNPDYIKTYNNRGNAFADMGQYQLAIADYNKAIQLKPDCADAYYNRGIAYADMGQYQLAIDSHSEAIRLKPYEAGIYNNRGAAYAAIGRYQNAIEDYSEAIRLKPDYTYAYYNRAIVYLSQGNKELGCHDAQKACTLGICKALEDAISKGYCREI